MSQEEANDYPQLIPNKPCGIDKYDGKSQERLANALASHIVTNDKNSIRNKKLSRIIGLQGEWGVGKSNVIKLLDNHESLKSDYYIFEYDAWGHQEDLQRRSFLETLTRKLIEDKVVDKTWEQKLDDLLAHKITRINKSLPKFDAGAFWTALFLALTPITVFIAERLENADIINCIWLLVLIGFFPILFGTLLWLILMIPNKEMRSLGWILQISKNESIKTKTTETINEKEPTVFEFKKWMNDVSNNLGNKKLIIVYDNMDRLPADKVKELWSSIYTFFSEDGFDNVWVIIPFDEEHLSCAFGESNDKDQLTKYFISKTFPIVYRVTPPVNTDFKSIFKSLFKEAFGEREIENHDEINRIFRLEKPNATVREIIDYINQLVILKNIWKDEIDLLYIAIFQLKKDEILKNNSTEQILSGKYLGQYIPSIIANDDVLQKNITALTYGVTLIDAEQIPMSKYLDGCFDLQKNADINKFADSSNFISILTDKVRQSDVAQLDNIVKTLSELDIINFEEEQKKAIALLWKHLAFKKMKTPLLKQEFDSTYQSLILNNDFKIQERILSFLCKEIQQFNSENFSGKNYFMVFDQIEIFLEKNKIKFDIRGTLREIQTNSKPFIDYVIEAKEKYSNFKLTADPSELDKYLLKLSPDNNIWKQMAQSNESKTLVDYSHDNIVLVIRVLFENKACAFGQFYNNVMQQIPNATTSNFKQYLDVYKILTNEMPFKIQLSLTQRQTFFNSLASNVGTSEFMEIVTIQIANGTNVGGEFSEENIKYIAENLDYYANYGDLLINKLSWNIPILGQALKYMTENKIGINLSLEKVLPKFFDIKNNIGIDETILIEQLNRWEESKDIIVSTNIIMLIPNAQFFVFSKTIKNTLTDYLNTVIVEALSEITNDQLYLYINQQNTYWTTVINTFIETEFLKKLPENLIELGKQYLDEIAAGKLLVPAEESIMYKIINQLNKEKTKETITSIRNQICNNVSGYTMNINKFLFLHEWFEAQGDLKNRAGDVCQYILTPIINDDKGLEIIIEKPEIYVEIINSAGQQSETFKKIIKDKLSSNSDEKLTSFAKLIGIDNKSKKDKSSNTAK